MGNTISQEETERKKMTICNTCGKQIPSYHVGDFFPDSQCLYYGNHPNTVIVPSPVIPPYMPWPAPPFYNSKEHCDHCYCKKETVNKTNDHKKCCQCGDRKLL